MIRYKDGVRFSTLRPEIKGVLAGIDVLFHQVGEHLCITCGTEGHPEDDPHTHGFAIDCRVHGLSISKQISLRYALEDYLGPRYTVLLEHPGEPEEHIHIQIKKSIWHEEAEKEKEDRVWKTI